MSLKKILLSVLVVCGLYKITIHELFYVREAPQASAMKAEIVPDEIDSFLSTPLSLIGIGSQCFAFSAPNSPYVLKICKAARYQSLFLLDNLLTQKILPSYTNNKKEKKKKRLSNDFSNYNAVHTLLPVHSGILYLHLEQTSSLKKKITIKVPLGLSLSLNSDDLLFYIQKKATPLDTYLLSLLEQKKEKELRQFLSQFPPLLLTCCNQGIWIKDTNFYKNIGVCEGSPLWIDPGKVLLSPSLSLPGKREEKMDRFQQKLETFLLSLDPQFETFFSQPPPV